LTSYYLDASAAGASDSNAGTSINAPFRTLAALKSFTAGDTIAIKAGTTYAGTLTINSSGSAGAPITFTKYGSGANPVISTTGQNAIAMQGANYVVVDGIDVAGAVGAGIRLDGNSAHNILQNMNVSRAGFGFEIDGAHDNLFTRNYVHDLRMIFNTPGGNDDYGAVAFDIKGNNNEFSFNRVINAQAPSYDYGMDGGGFEFWRSVSNVKIHDNFVENSSIFVESGGMGAADVLSGIQIYNNVSTNNGAFEWIHNDASTKFGQTLNGLVIRNNTIYEPTANTVVGIEGPVVVGSYSFINNLVYAPKAEVFSQPGNYHQNNFYQVAVTPTGTGERAGTISFTNPAAGDYHVPTGSAAAQYGAYAGVPQPTVPPPAGSSTVTRQTLDVGISGDQYNGDAQFTVSVDGQQIGGTQTAHVRHASGADGHFLLTGTWASGQHDVKIAFINDAWGGTAATDRNLYLASIALDGKTYAGTSATFMAAGSRSFAVGGSVATTAADPDKLVLRLGEDAWNGDAMFQVSIDGKTLNSAESVTARHSTGGVQDFIFSGNFGPGQHDVGVTFLNDAWGGSASTDRNLYVNSVSFDSHTYAGATMLSGGTTHFLVSA
jgi:Ca-dependent carbohydrate-binding module xylan-binding/Right handed beta helix region